MIIFKLLLTLALPLLLGYTIVAAISRGRTFIESFGLAWLIGIGLLGLEMFAISLLNIHVDIQTVSIPALAVLAGLAVYLLFRRVRLVEFPSFGKLRPAEILLVILIALTIGYVFFDALVKPIVNFDDLWRQGCIAKIVFVTGKVLTEQAIGVAGAHPYLNPLSQAWIYMGIGAWNDALGKIVFPLCFLSLLFIFYAGLRRSASRFNALLFTYLLASFPLIIYHTGTAYSDLMQTVYYSTGIIYLYQWMKEKQNQHLYFSALLLGIGNFVKLSGIPLWGIATVVLFAYLFFENRKELKAGAWFLLISILVSAPWLFFQNSFLMSRIGGLGGKLVTILGGAAITGAEVAVSQNLPYGPPTLAGIFHHLGRRMFTYADWQVLWFAFAAAVVFGWKKILDSKLKYLLLIIILDLGMVAYAFLDPGTYQFLVDGTLVERALMYQVPVVLFFIALSARSRT